MKRLLIAGAALALVTPALAQVAQAPTATGQPRPAMKVHSRADVQAKVAEHFARLDANRDGFVTKAEAEAGRKAMRVHVREQIKEQAGENRAQLFERLDANRDGQISRQEWDSGRAMHEKRIVMRREGRAGPGMRMGMGMGALRGHMFEMADSNRDGRVTLQEAQAAALRHFDMADVNRDGRITPDERRQMRERMRAEHRPG